MGPRASSTLSNRWLPARYRTAGFDVLCRPGPELEFEGWLAIYPDALTEDPEPLIEEFCERWEIELDDDTREALLETFHRVRREELDGDDH